MPREQRPGVKYRFIKPIGSYKDEKWLSMNRKLSKVPVWTVFGAVFQFSVKISELTQNYNPLI
jgi:hypothetical protein